MGSPATSAADTRRSAASLAEGADSRTAGPLSAARLGGGLLLLFAMVWSYWPTLREMELAWSREADYSHGYLVAPLAIIFLWLRRDAFPREKLRVSWWGLAVLVAVAMVRIAAGLWFLLPLDGWTFPLALAGGVLLLFGPACLRWSLPSLAFLWFMTPIPFRAETWLSVPLQSLATTLSTAALVTLGQPAIAEGNVIWLGDQQLFVEEACSGMRIFVGIFALAFAFVLFSRWSWWQKGLALVAAFPIAVLANVMRIVATGLLYQWVSGEAAHKFSHDLSGFFMIPVAAGLFWLFLKYLDAMFVEVEEAAPSVVRGAWS